MKLLINQYHPLDETWEYCAFCLAGSLRGAGGQILVDGTPMDFICAGCLGFICKNGVARYRNYLKNKANLRRVGARLIDAHAETLSDDAEVVIQLSLVGGPDSAKPGEGQGQ